MIIVVGFIAVRTAVQKNSNCIFKNICKGSYQQLECSTSFWIVLYASIIYKFFQKGSSLPHQIC